jgi:hypothetical protein
MRGPNIAHFPTSAKHKVRGFGATAFDLRSFAQI